MNGESDSRREAGRAGFARVARLDELPRGRGRRVIVGGVPVALFRIGDRVHAVGDRCPHMGASLAEGHLEGDRVVCGWHGWSFDLATGASGRRSGACVRTWETRVEAGEVWIRVAAPDESRAAAELDEEWAVFDPERHLRRDPER